ncbi:unnamed protein product [Calypogeia fissa]
MSMDVQRQIRENTLELNEFLKDLKGWEHTVKEKEKKLQSRGPAKDKKISGSDAPLRKLPSDSKPDGKDVQEISRNQAEAKATPANDSEGQVEVKNESELSKNSDKSPAGHTYDHFRDKWDKFDVDAALKALDNEDGQSVKKVLKREIRPPRGSQSQTSVDKLSEGRRKASAVSPSLPPGKILGGGSQPMAAASKISQSYGFDDALPDAASEKDLGNDYFKEGKYVRAIDCYSRSIALQPTAVAYANRAMAAIKIRRFEDAELDCTEAIALDDRYTKAYARRGTARRELKKYLAAAEDLEFALRLEPDNKELKKQYTEVEELCEKERRGKPPQQRSPFVVKERDESVSPNQKPNHEKPTVAFVDKPQSPSKPVEVVTDAAIESTPKEQADADVLSTKQNPREQPNESPEEPREPPNELPKEPPEDRELLPGAREIPNTIPIVPFPPKQARVRDRKMAEVVAATQAAAARAAASAMAAVSRNIVAPRSSYEFELAWKGFEGNKNSQVRLLKIMDPLSLPKVFKDSLGAPLLLEIIQSLELLFPDDAELAVQILENLTKVGRFNMTVMFLTSKDKTGLGHLWEEVFMKSPQELQTRLQDLRSAYRLV